MTLFGILNHSPAGSQSNTSLIILRLIPILMLLVVAVYLNKKRNKKD